MILVIPTDIFPLSYFDPPYINYNHVTIIIWKFHSVLIILTYLDQVILTESFQYIFVWPQSCSNHCVRVYQISIIVTWVMLATLLADYFGWKPTLRYSHGLNRYDIYPSNHEHHHVTIIPWSFYHIVIILISELWHFP